MLEFELRGRKTREKRLERQTGARSRRPPCLRQRAEAYAVEVWVVISNKDFNQASNMLIIPL